MPVADRAPIVVKQRIQCLDIVRDERLLVTSKGRLNLYLCAVIIKFHAILMHCIQRTNNAYE